MEHSGRVDAADAARSSPVATRGGNYPPLLLAAPPPPSKRGPRPPEHKIPHPAQRNTIAGQPISTTDAPNSKINRHRRNPHGGPVPHRTARTRHRTARTRRRTARSPTKSLQQRANPAQDRAQKSS
jgi:hypothetical protein